MNYEKKTFSVAMPGAGADWSAFRDYAPGGELASCKECARLVAKGSAHINLQDEIAGLVRKRVCMGKVLTPRGRN